MNGWFHRGVGSAEHDMSVSAIHGFCRICATPWPCDAQREADRAAMAYGDQAAEIARLKEENEKLRIVLRGIDETTTEVPR